MKRGNIFAILGLAIALLTSATVATGAQLSDYFKSTAWVAQHIKDKNFVIVDTRSTANYNAGHIPGAISIPRNLFYFPRHVIDPATGSYKVDSNGNAVQIAYDIPTPAELIDILTRNGITPDSTVVAYDNDTSSYGGRFPWVLKVYGHKKAYVIDGGIDKWKDADGRTLSATVETPTPAAKPYKIAGYQNYRVTKSDIAAIIDTANGNVTKKGYVISDVRTPSEYTGFATTVTSGAASTGAWDVTGTAYVLSKNEGARPGHIPYAEFSDYASAAFTDYINPATGKPVPGTLQANHNVQVLKSAKDLQAHFKKLGITSGKIVYNYCEGGFRSGVYTLILLGLGYPHVYNYDGSWNEWSIEGDQYPVATGDGRVAGP
jgi:thiosulfate/3-mercaptopyruvate sulfurtransferase